MRNYSLYVDWKGLGHYESTAIRPLRRAAHNHDVVLLDTNYILDTTLGNTPGSTISCNPIVFKHATEALDMLMHTLDRHENVQLPSSVLREFNIDSVNGAVMRSRTQRGKEELVKEYLSARAKLHDQLTRKVYTNNYRGDFHDAINAIDVLITQNDTKADKDLVNIAHMCAFNAERCAIMSSDVGVKDLTLILNYLVRRQADVLLPAEVSVYGFINRDERFKRVFNSHGELHIKYLNLIKDISMSTSRKQDKKELARIEKEVIPETARRLGALDRRLIVDPRKTIGLDTIVMTPRELHELREVHGELISENA